MAERWVPWLEAQVADLKNSGLLGTTGFMAAITSAARAKLDGIGTDSQITFKNITQSMVQTLADFHRKVLGHSNHEIFYALGSGWKAGEQIEPEVPADELARAKADCATPYIEVPFKPVEPVKETKPVDLLF